MSLVNDLKEFFGDGELRVTILGIGSPIRSDDAVGLKVVEYLEEKGLENVQIINSGTVPESFTGKIREYMPTHVLMIDAAHIEEEPGVSRVIPTQMICDVCLSTHKLPLTVLTNYLDKTLGAKVGLVGIQPLSILFGEEMTPELVKAAKEVAEAILKVLNDN